MRSLDPTSTCTGVEAWASRPDAPAPSRRRGLFVPLLLMSGVVTPGLAAAAGSELPSQLWKAGSGAEAPAAPIGPPRLPGSFPIADDPEPTPAPDEGPADEPPAADLPPPFPPEGEPALNDERPPKDVGADSDGAAPAPKLQVEGDAEAVDLRAEDADLADVVNAVARASGVNAVVAPGVAEVVRVTLLQVPPREAIELVGVMTRCEREELPGGVLLLTQPPRISLDFEQASGRFVLQLLAKYSGRDVLVEPRILGTLDVSFREVKFSEALRSVVTQLNAHLAWRGDVALVTAAPLPLEALGLAANDLVRVVTRAGETHVGALRDPGRRQLTIEDMASSERRVFERREVLSIEPVRSAVRGGRDELERRLDLNVIGAELATVCEQLGAELGAQIQVDPGVNAPSITCSLRQVSGRVALEVLALLAGCSLEERPGGLLVLTQPPEFTLQTADCALPAFYRLLAGAAGQRVVVADDVDGTITVDLERVSPLDALVGAALVHGHTVVSAEEGALSIRPAAYAGGWNLPLAPAGASAGTGGDRRSGGQLPDPDEAAEADASPDWADEEVEARVRALFATIERQTQQRQIEELIGSFTKLRQIMSESRGAREQVRARLQASRPRLEPSTEVVLSIELMLMINEGSQHLRDMADAIREERYQDAQDGFAKLHALVAAQRERPVFQRNGAALLERGRVLAARARELANLPLAVTAILSFGAGAPERGAAVINGWLVREGETARDAQGDPLPGVTLTSIEPGVIKLRVKGGDVERRLAAPR